MDIDEYILKNYKKMTNFQISEVLSVSETTVIRKIKALKLSRRFELVKLPNEIFKKIPGYSKYKVSNIGRFLKISDMTEILQSETPDGYACIKLVNDNGKRVTNRSHRIIAMVFIKNHNIPLKTEVNHINGIKKDNRIENLEWVTPGENQKHSYSIKLRISKKGESSHLSNYTEDQVRLVCRDIENGISTVNIYNKYDWIKSKGFIEGIKNRGRWSHISKEYNFK